MEKSLKCTDQIETVTVTTETKSEYNREKTKIYLIRKKVCNCKNNPCSKNKGKCINRKTIRKKYIDSDKKSIQQAK